MTCSGALLVMGRFYYGAGSCGLGGGLCSNFNLSRQNQGNEKSRRRYKGATQSAFTRMDAGSDLRFQPICFCMEIASRQGTGAQTEPHVSSELTIAAPLY